MFRSHLTGAEAFDVGGDAHGRVCSVGAILPRLEQGLGQVEVVEMSSGRRPLLLLACNALLQDPHLHNDSPSQSSKQCGRSSSK